MVGNIAINPYINTMYQSHLKGVASPRVNSQGRSVNKNNDFGLFAQTGQIQHNKRVSTAASSQGITKPTQQLSLTQNSINNIQAGNYEQVTTNDLWNYYGNNDQKQYSRDIVRNSRQRMTDIIDQKNATLKEYVQYAGRKPGVGNDSQQLWDAYSERVNMNTTNNNLGNLQDVRGYYAQETGYSSGAQESDVLNTKGADIRAQNDKVLKTINNDFNMLRATRADLDRRGLWNIRNNFKQNASIQHAANGILNNPNVEISYTIPNIDGTRLCFYKNAEGNDVGKILYDTNGNILSVEYFEDKDSYSVVDIDRDGITDYADKHIEKKESDKTKKKENNRTSKKENDKTEKKGNNKEDKKTEKKKHWLRDK